MFLTLTEDNNLRLEAKKVEDVFELGRLVGILEHKKINHDCGQNDEIVTVTIPIIKKAL